MMLCRLAVRMLAWILRESREGRVGVVRRDCSRDRMLWLSWTSCLRDCSSVLRSNAVSCAAMIADSCAL